jgi:hypothetical protein
MGFANRIGNSIRAFFDKDKDKAALQLAKGQTNAASLGGGDLLSQYGYDYVAEYLRLDADLMGRYVDYEDMDDYPELSASLDIYADDASQPDTQLNRTIWVTAKDRSIERIGNDLFHKTLRADEEIQEIARELCKMGNEYEELLVTQDGVVGMHCLRAPTVRRIEGPRGQLIGFLQDFKGKFNYSTDEFKGLLAARMRGEMANADQDRIAALEDWEVVHFRLRGKQRQSVYGHSVLEPARWIYKRLSMLEDSALIYRLQRAPERYAFYVDVGDLPPTEAMAYLNRVRQQFRKKKFVNPSTGKLDMRIDPMAQDEDFFVPTRKGQDGTRIEVLGSPQWQHMDDIEYFRSKLFAAIKIPKAYLAQDENTARAVLSSEDVRFARSVLRVQREIRNGFSRIMRVHLAALNIDPYGADYDINMTVPSSVFELAQIEVRNARADLAMRMKEFVSLRWTLEHVFGMSDDDIEQIIKERGEDVKRDTMAQAGADADANMQYGMPDPLDPGAPGGVPAQVIPGGQESRHTSRAGDIQRMLAEGRDRRRLWTPRRGAGGISEAELMRGSREAEKRAGEKLDRLLKNDVHLQRRLGELGGMLQDLRASSRPRRP